MIHFLTMAAIASAATCERATTAGDIDAGVHRARQAYVDQDPVALAAACDETIHALECVVEPIRPGQAEAVHFVRGLWAATERGEAATVPYLAAARVDRTDGTLEFALTDRERNTVDRLSADLSSFQITFGTEAPPALRGRLVIDGRVGDRRPPANAPYVLQRVSGSTVLDSRYVFPGEPLPRYRRLRPALAGTAIGFGAVSAGLLAGGEITWSRLHADHDPLLSGDEVDALQQANHRFLIGAAATGAVGALALGAWGLSFAW